MRPLLPAALALILVAAWLPAAAAHPGGLDGDGCHHDRKRGGYHCHRRKAAARRAEDAPVRGPSFRNCTAARAAGAAPVLRGDPGYGAHLDRDNDGIGCE